MFDGACSDEKLTMMTLKKQFPNCANDLAKALAKKKLKKVVKSKFQMKMKGVTKEEVQNMKQNKDVVLSMQRSIANQHPGIETEDVTIIDIKLVDERRLNEGRLLSTSSKVDIDYEIGVPEESDVDPAALAENVKSSTNANILALSIADNLAEDAGLAVTVEEVVPSQEVVVEEPPTEAPTTASGTTASPGGSTGSPTVSNATTTKTTATGAPATEKTGASSADGQTILFATTFSLLMASLRQ